MSESALVSLNNVSVRFKAYHGRSTGLKEMTMRFLRPPEWQRINPPRKEVFWGLKEINLDLHEGDRLGIVGNNGAGKSTLLKVISRIYRPTRGTVKVKGRIAPLIEIGAGFHPELSGRENIFLNGAVLGIPKKVLRQKLDSIIDFSGLDKFIDTPVKYYSTGMHLRLGFAIATEVSPDILILDELFTGGDANFIERANARLKSFIEKSRVLILVTHDLKYVTEYCNKAILVEKGEITYRGGPETILQRYQERC